MAPANLREVLAKDKLREKLTELEEKQKILTGKVDEVKLQLDEAMRGVTHNAQLQISVKHMLDLKLSKKSIATILGGAQATDVTIVKKEDGEQ